MADEVERGRAAFARRAWGEASALLAAAAPSDVDDLERLAVAAQLAGHADESEQAWTRAHLECARLGDADRAVRCAFWLGFALLLRGDVAQGGGWLGRAARMVEEAGPVGAGPGFLLVPAFMEAIGGGDHGRAGALAAEAVEIAQRFADPDLLALGLLCRGEARLAARDAGPGLQRLDEAMLVGTSGDRLAAAGRGRVLRGHRRLYGRVRPAPRCGVDRRPHHLVHGPARPRSVPRAVPRAPRPAAPGQRGVG